MRSPYAFWEVFAGIRSREESRLFLMSAYLSLIITCYTTTKAVRDSLFVTEVGTSQLPYLYMLTACFMALISSFYPGLLRRNGLHTIVRATSLIGIASLLVFWSLIPWQGNTSIYILYVWVSLFGAITASQAWSLASQVFDAREARRSFGWIGLGGVIGGIVGGTLAQYIAPLWGTEALLPVCAGLMVVTIGILQQLARPEDWDAPKDAATESVGTNGSGPVTSAIRESPYISMLVTLLIAGVIVEAFIDYEFKAIAVESLRSKDNLTSFFGTIASYGGILALLFQTLVTNRLLKRFGVGAAILLLPTALLASFLVVAAWPVLWAISLLKLLDICLSYSVHRSGMELLYVPIPAAMRASVKGLIDMFVDRAGRAAGGFLLVALTAGLSFSVPSLSLVAALFLVVWLAMAWVVRRNYVHAFRVALEKKIVEPETLEVRALDSSIVGALIHALSSADDRQVLYALDLLGRIHPSRWHRHVPALLQHKSAAVRARTIALLTHWHVESSSLVSPSLRDPELEVRVEAIRHLCAVPELAGAKLKEFLFHDDYRIVLAAIHCMAKYQFGDQGLIDAELIGKALTTTGDHELIAKTAAARALAIARLPETARFLDRLLQDSRIEVVRHAASTAGEIGYEDSIPALISMLARPRLRRVARESLLKLGPPAEWALRSRLQDRGTPLEVRVRIPKVLSHFGMQDVADFVLGCVHASTPRLDMPLLKALNRIRERSPEVSFDADRVLGLIQLECEKHGRLRLIYRAMESGIEGDDHRIREVLALMTKALGERMSEGLERVFRLLALIHPQADIHAVFFNITARPALRPSALEFLDNLIEPPLRSLVMPLVEDHSEGDDEGLEDREMLRDEALRTLLAEDDEWIRTIAKELVVRLGMKETVSPEAA